MIRKGCRNFAVRRTTTGLGLLTMLPVGAGKRLIEYVGPVVTAEAVGRSRGKYFFRIDEGHAVDGSARGNLARYINHCCRPNTEAFVYGRRVWIYSKRALRAGEQITIDYGQEYLTAHMSQVICKCEVCACGATPKDGLHPTADTPALMYINRSRRRGMPGVSPLLGSGQMKLCRSIQALTSNTFKLRSWRSPCLRGAAEA